MNTALLSCRSARRPGRRGFSLAELMVVIVILGLLATLVAQNVVPILFKANTAVVKSDINAICGAIDNYLINNGNKAPDSLEVLVTPDENGHTYLKSLPLDPWKNPYVYEPPVGTQGYRVICYGRDGAPGGEGEDVDIDNISILERK
jgi:general secretion pathway protein G